MRTIDADALLERWCSEVCKGKPYCKEDCMLYDYLTIDSLSPTIEPEPHWIPCSEKMPEEYEWIGTKRFGTTISDEVYVTFENEKGERFCRHMKFQNRELGRYDQVYMDAWFKGGKPIAWMELPKPYKAESEYRNE